MSTDSVSSHPPESYSSPPESQHSLPVIVTVVLLFFFILGFFTIYLCRYLTDPISNSRWLRRRNNSTGDNLQQGDRTVGLDPSIISSFPTYPYSAVKDIRQGKTGLECAVCISEFSDDDVLRLLTVCSHAFHPECIDLWLGSHTTCPVCRRNLDSAEKTSIEVSFMVPEIYGEEERRVDNNNNNNTNSHSHRISFKDEEEGERRGGGATAERIVLADERLQRSHSTGHSLVRNVGEDDRFTLLLPENVKERIKRGRNWTGSCGTLGDFSGDVVMEKFGVADRPDFRFGDVTRV